MTISLGIFIFSLLVSLPLICVLLYVWHKYGKGEKKVMLARVVFLFGVVGIILYMTSLVMV